MIICKISNWWSVVYVTECINSLLTLYGHIKTAEQRSIIQQQSTVIGTLAVDGWAVRFGTARRATAPPSPLLAIPNVTAHPSTASIPTSHYSVWHYNCLWFKGLNSSMSARRYLPAVLATAWDQVGRLALPVRRRLTTKLCLNRCDADGRFSGSRVIHTPTKLRASVENLLGNFGIGFDSDPME